MVSGTSSWRRMISVPAQPTSRPMAMPAPADQTKSSSAPPGEKVPATAAVSATL